MDYWRLLGVCLAYIAVAGSSKDREGEVYLEPQDLEILVGKEETVSILATRAATGEALFQIGSKHDDVVRVEPKTLEVDLSEGRWELRLTGENPGHDVVSLNVTPPFAMYEKRGFIRVTVCKSTTLSLTSVIVGWIYFAAWSVSFYPQVYENWKRKSVVGLNFDFLTLNIIGFTLYSIFNCCLYWIPLVEEEYFGRHPKGLNPVQLNDIVFSVHASIVTLLTIFQCLIYERGGQSVSKVAMSIIMVFALCLVVMLALTLTNVVHWLDFLYACSYIKLTITLIKYIPQAVMNYRRKSTIGWSIGNVVLDFTGGILSMLQMIINADNYNDWDSIFGDPTKFGLGLFSVLFDIFFLIQHYILYRNAVYTEIPGSSGSPEGIRRVKTEQEEEVQQNAENEKMLEQSSANKSNAL